MVTSDRSLSGSLLQGGRHVQTILGLQSQNVVEKPPSLPKGGKVSSDTGKALLSVALGFLLVTVESAVLPLTAHFPAGRPLQQVESAWKSPLILRNCYCSWWHYYFHVTCEVGPEGSLIWGHRHPQKLGPVLLFIQQ